MRYYSSIAQQMALVGAIDAAATSITVDKATGLPASTPFTLILDHGKPDLEEIATVTAVAGLSLTVVRGEDGSAAQAHTPGAVVRHAVTARDLREPQQHMVATAGVHGLAAGESPASAALLAATAAGLSTETTNRINGDAANANANTANATAIAAEVTNRQNAGALLVPKTTAVNGHALSGSVTVTQADLGITSGTVLPGSLANGNIFLLIVG